MKILKKLAALLLIAALLLAFGGCAASDAAESAVEILDGLIDIVLSEEAEATPAPEPTEEPFEAAPPTAEPTQTPEAAPAAAPEAPTEETPAPEPTEAPEEPSEEPQPEVQLPEDGSYDSKDDVALYLHLYGHLPDNYITKKEAQALGWSGGGLDAYAPGKSIGGDRFGNYEGLLPQDKKYTECDIGTMGASSRGARRIVFSSDGYIYYTDDHYESFTLLYGPEGAAS